ncbi:hypothetical protein Aduo_004309 [Ancylostoma duodenale]
MVYDALLGIAFVAHRLCIPNDASISARDSCVAYVVSGGRARWTSRPCEAAAYYLCAFTPIVAERSQEVARPTTEEPKVVFEGTRL